MKSYASRGFWERFARLPKSVQDAAHKQFELWLEDPGYPSLRFKPLHRANLWSVRVTGDYRAVGYFRASGEFRWIWIGPHAEYDAFIRQFH